MRRRAGDVEAPFRFWLAAQGKAQATIDNYLEALRAWKRWCAENEVNPFRGVTLQELVAWRADMALRLAPSTASLRTIGVRVFFNYLVDAGLLPNNPAERLKPRRPQSRPVQPFTQQELMGMLTACKTPQDRAIFLLLLGGGLRRDEVFQITRAHVNFEDGTITVLGKGARYRTIAPGNACIEALRFALAYNDRLCWQGARADFVWRRVRILAKRAGIKGRIHPHRFRYQFAVEVSDAGMSIDQLMVVLGHSDAKMSMKYARAGRERRALNTQRLLSPADRLLEATS